MRKFTKTNNKNKRLIGHVAYNVSSSGHFLGTFEDSGFSISCLKESYGDARSRYRQKTRVNLERKMATFYTHLEEVSLREMISESKGANAA